jgi:hypothetical protein
LSVERENQHSQQRLGQHSTKGGIMERLRRRAALVTGLCLTMVCLGVSSPSYAIPIAGNYVFTNGLGGTFTSNGTQLTAWNITTLLSPTIFCAACGQQTSFNDSSSFVTIDKSITPNEELSISWANNSWGLLQETQSTGTFAYKAKIAGVPEPSVVLLLSGGLLALALYGRQQRRQTGLQVG